MEKIKIKKPLNLHKYSVKLNTFTINKKLILPLIFTVFGIALGSAIAKGESELYLFFSNYFKLYLYNRPLNEFYSYFAVYLLIPTVFAIIIFFNGLTIYGVITVNCIPMIYATVASAIIYLMYNEFELKGLAYIVMIHLPYVIPSILALIRLSVESTNMSQFLLKTVSKINRKNDYNFNTYCKSCLKNYIVIVVAALIRSIIENSFSGLFVF